MPGKKTQLTPEKYEAYIARVYHHQLRVKLREPLWNTFWWVMFEWAQRARRNYANSLGNGQGSLF